MAKRRIAGKQRVKSYRRKDGTRVKGYLRRSIPKTKPARFKGTLGAKMRLPTDEMSPAFRKYTMPVGNQKRIVYVFAEVQDYELDLDGERVPVIAPIVIGKMTRRQLAKMRGSELRDRLTFAVPGKTVVRIAGFGHALTRLERKGMRFVRAKNGDRKSRRTSNKSGNRPPKKGRKKS